MNKWRLLQRASAAVVVVALCLLAVLIFSPGLVGFADSEALADRTASRAPFADAWRGSSPDLADDERVPASGAEPGRAAESGPASHVMNEARRPAAQTREGGRNALEGRFDCLIQSTRLVGVGSSLSGVLEEVHVDRSDFVEAGQLLAELESAVELAAVEVARMRADMNGDVGANRASAKLGGSKRARAQQLFEAAAISIEERDEVFTEAELASFALQRAREERALAGAELARAEEQLERRRIRSPISGVVVDRLKHPGEVVKEETVVTVAQVDPLAAEVVLPAAYFGAVKPGDRAEVVPELEGSGVRIATVDVVDRVIDAASGTFRVRLEIPNADRALPSGLHCEVRFLPPE